MVVYTCDPSYSEGQGMRSTWTQEVEVAVSVPLYSSLGDRARICLKKKKRKEKKKKYPKQHYEVCKMTQNLKYKSIRIG